MKKDFWDRIIELLKTDQELHDAAVRMMNSTADVQAETALRMKAKRENAKKR